MKECRVSIHGQVIEVFEKDKYEGEQFDFIRHEIKECLESTEPLMWVVDDNFTWDNPNDKPVEPEIDPKITLDGLDIDEVIELLKWRGVI